MGEAVYYIGATFKSKKHTERVFKEFQSLNKEGQQAYKFWQAHRGENSEKFSEAFIQNFPVVCNFLGELPKDSNNGYAGRLNFIDEENDGSISLHETTITASATVWHFADWDDFEIWFKERDALRVVCFSDEYTDLNELLYYKLLDTR